MRRRKRTIKDRGFTLIEMLAVLALMALAAGAAMITQRPPSDTLELDAAARKLCASIRYARSCALAGSTETLVSIDTRAGTYTVMDAPPVALPQRTVVVVTFASSERLSASQGSFRFFPSGEATGGEIRLTRGAAASRIAVNWLTGEARCGE